MLKHARSAKRLSPPCVAAVIAAFAAPACADDADDLSKKLSNPIANLISVPFQHNFDYGGGPANAGLTYTLNVQPVIPFKLNQDWLVITRTIMPIIGQNGITDRTAAGLGDITQSFFFSPVSSGIDGFTWGIGPVFLYPSATNQLTGSGKWAAGPTLVALQQTGPWTIGILANHLWSYAGDDDRDPVSATFIQPFLAYAVGKGLTLSLNTESSYNWTTEQWTVPIIAGFSQVFKVGEQAMSFGMSGKWFVVTPTGGPEWGIRAQWTLIFPTQ